MKLSRIEKDIAFLAGPATTGRLSGTKGALLTAHYLAGELDSAGFQPTQNGSFMQPLTVPVSYLTGVPRLQIGNETFQHRNDYGEILPMSTGGGSQGL